MDTKGRKSTNGFFKFPRTPHLFVAPDLFIRDDKILDQLDMKLFLYNPIVLEEKVDGANIGISLSESGSLQIQNRGNFISCQNHSQFTHIWDWAYLRLNLIQKYITDEFIIFWEWLRSTSKLYSGFIEGIYIRYEDSEQLLKRAKIVKTEFIQEIDIHWSNKKMVINNLQS